MAVKNGEREGGGIGHINGYKMITDNTERLKQQIRYVLLYVYLADRVVDVDVVLAAMNI